MSTADNTNRNCIAHFRSNGFLFKVAFVLLILFCGCQAGHNELKTNSRIWNKVNFRFDRYLYAYSASSDRQGNVWFLTNSVPSSFPSPYLPVSLFYSHNNGNKWSYCSFKGQKTSLAISFPPLTARLHIRLSGMKACSKPSTAAQHGSW